MRFGRQNFLGVCLSVVCQKDALIIAVTLVFFVFFLISWADLLDPTSRFGAECFFATLAIQATANRMHAIAC
jgi:hypothetical protein